MKKTRIFSAVALAVLVLAAAVFFYLTYTSNFIPLQIWVVALVSCLLVIMIIAFVIVFAMNMITSRNLKNRKRG